jgi:hypothetical protein
VDLIFTGHSDDDGRDDDVGLQKSENGVNYDIDAVAQIVTSYDELPISSLTSIGRETSSTSPTLLCHLDETELFDSLKAPLNTSSTHMSHSSSSVSMMTTSTSHTPASSQTTLAVVPGSSEIAITESIVASTLEDAFMSATSQVQTGTTSLDNNYIRCNI